MLQASIDNETKRGLAYGVLVTQILEQCGVTFPKDVVTLSQGLPIDDASIKRIKGQRRAAPQVAQAVGEVAQPIPAPVPTPAPTKVPPPALEPITTGTSTFVPPTPSTSETAAPALSVTLPPALSTLIRDIHGDFRCILRCFDCLWKKVESMDQRLIHIEGIVDPSRSPAPRVILDILASDEDADEDEEESSEDA